MGSNAAAWNIGALAAVACLLVHSVVDFNLHIPANALVLAFVFGVLANPGRPLPPARPTGGAFSGGPDLWPRLALPALGGWVCSREFTLHLPGAFYAEKARVALRDNRPAAALNFARQGLATEHADPILYGHLGDARMDLAGNGPDTPFARSFREAALGAYREAVRLSPQDSNLQARLGEDLYPSARFRRGGRGLSARPCAGTRIPGTSWVYDGFYLQSRGDLAGAQAAYERARGHYPPYAAADKGLAEIARLKAAAGGGAN